MSYIVQTYGYYNCPEFKTLGGARECLRALVKESYESAKCRWKGVKKRKISEDSYEIVLGCNLWAAHSIQHV